MLMDFIQANFKRQSIPTSSSTSSHDTEFWVNQKREERKVSLESGFSKPSKGSTNKRTSSSDDTQFWVGLQEKKKIEQELNQRQSLDTKETPGQIEDVEGKHPFNSN